MEEEVEYISTLKKPETGITIKDVVRWYPWASPEVAKIIFNEKLYYVDGKGIDNYYFDKNGKVISERRREMRSAKLILQHSKEKLAKLKDRRFDDIYQPRLF